MERRQLIATAFREVLADAERALCALEGWGSGQVDVQPETAARFCVFFALGQYDKAFGEYVRGMVGKDDFSRWNPSNAFVEFADAELEKQAEWAKTREELKAILDETGEGGPS